MSVENRRLVEDTLDLIVKYCNDVAVMRHRVKDRKGFDDDIMAQYGLSMAVSQIGECVRRIDMWLENHSEYDWSRCIGMRNLITHRYQRIDYDLVWKSINDDVPDVLKIVLRLKDIIPDCPDEDFLNIRTNALD